MLSDTIKEIRKRNYLNQTAFANRIGVTQGTVSQWENGLTRPNSDQLKSISANFNISIDELLRGEIIKEEPQKEQALTPQIRIVSGWMEKMPQEDQDRVVQMMQVMFMNHPELLRREDSADD